MTMNDTTVGVLVTMDEDVTTKMPAVTNSLVQNRSAIRELGMGTAYLSSMMMTLGIAMKNTNNSTLQGMSSMMLFVGSLGSSLTMAVRFVSSMARMTHSLQEFNVAQLFANLLSGPAGWAKLLIGGAIAGGALFGMTKLLTSKSTTTASTTTIHQHIAGSVVTSQNIIDMTQQGLKQKDSRQGWH